MALRKKPSKSNTNIRQLITKVSPRSPVSEQYRTIRTNLQFASVDKELKSFLVTSSAPAEGKSSTVANLAIVFAQQGKKVLVIDADMRKPTLHYTFQLKNQMGLSNLLVGDCRLEDAVSKNELPNLEFLTCGPIPPNPSELLGSAAMERLMLEATNKYDLVIFDTPPVLAVTDAQILANVCDGTVMVVRNKQTEYDTVHKACDLLKPAKAKLLGVVLNDRKEKKKNRDQYYYYGTT